jgi:predicted SAM-dependent methyltransferase
MIFSEHMLEHIPLDSAFELLKECARVLRPGHIVRLSVPSLELKVEQYVLESQRADEEPDQLLGPGVLLNELFYFHGHRSMFDYTLLSKLMIAAGFVTVSKSEFGEGALAPELDSPERKQYSLYIEASR